MSDFRDLIHDPKCRPRFEALLRLAAQRGDEEQVVERLSWGIDPNCETKTGRTPLICNVVSSCPSSRVVQALLAAGADPDHLDHKGLTALDYANRKLARINLRPRRPPHKSPSLDENDQLILAPSEQQMLDEVRRDDPKIAKQFVTSYLKERLKAAKRVFNDPAEVERIVDLLTAAKKDDR
jgi:ankyrin repeat protein